MAVGTGFHSLVELIAKHETNQSAKDAALGDAVSLRRLDLVELLLANGADVKAVRLADVLLTWEPKLIRFGGPRKHQSGRSRRGTPAARALASLPDCQRASSALRRPSP